MKSKMTTPRTSQLLSASFLKLEFALNSDSVCDSDWLAGGQRLSCIVNKIYRLLAKKISNLLVWGWKRDIYCRSHSLLVTVFDEMVHQSRLTGVGSNGTVVARCAVTIS
jgi:hypothetical protein